MFKHVAQLTRKGGLSHDEFIEYWSNTHADIATNIEGLERYQQIHPVDPETAPVDGLAELYFESLQRLTAALGDEGTRYFSATGDCAKRARQDLDNFVEIEGRRKIAGREIVETNTVARDTDGLYKCSTFLIRDEKTSHETFLRRWENEYTPHVIEIPEVFRHTRVVPNDPAVSEFDGISELYFEQIGDGSNGLQEMPSIEDFLPVDSTQRFVGREWIQLTSIDDC